MRARSRGIVRAVLMLVSVLGAVGPAHAATGVLRVMISGAMVAPSGTSGDGQVTLRLGTGLPVFLVSDGGAVIAGSIATATFAQWSDTVPSPGFGAGKTLIVFRPGGGTMVVAGAVATPGGTVTTFSATSPVATLSGTWTMTSGAGVTGAGAGDAVVTFTFDTNPSNTISGLVRFAADGYLPAGVTKAIPGVASVDVHRNIPVRGVANNTVGPEIGTLVSYSAASSEFVALTAINFGGVYVVYACAFPQLPGGIACPIGGAGPVAHLSGNVSEVAGQFFTSPPNAIAGVDDTDLVLTLLGSLP